MRNRFALALLPFICVTTAAQDGAPTYRKMGSLSIDPIHEAERLWIGEGGKRFIAIDAGDMIAEIG